MFKIEINKNLLSLAKKHPLLAFIIVIVFIVGAYIIQPFIVSYSRENKVSQKMSNSPGSTQVGGNLYQYNLMPDSDKRPYLSIELEPDGWLRKDGNSNLFLMCCYDKVYLILPFRIRNVGKIHATKINAEYSSPAQPNVRIELGEKSLLLSTGDKMPEVGLFRPHINISGIVNNRDIKEFEIELVVSYQRYDQDDPYIYNTKLSLILERYDLSNQQLSYRIKRTDPKYGKLSF